MVSDVEGDLEEAALDAGVGEGESGSIVGSDPDVEANDKWFGDVGGTIADLDGQRQMAGLCEHDEHRGLVVVGGGVDVSVVPGELAMCSGHACDRTEDEEPWCQFVAVEVLEFRGGQVGVLSEWCDPDLYGEVRVAHERCGDHGGFSGDEVIYLVGLVGEPQGASWTSNNDGMFLAEFGHVTLFVGSLVGGVVFLMVLRWLMRAFMVVLVIPLWHRCWRQAIVVVVIAVCPRWWVWTIVVVMIAARR